MLLRSTFLLNSDAFLFSVKICKNFEVFADLVEESKATLETLNNKNNENLINILQVISLVYGCNTSKLPSKEDISNYETILKETLKRASLLKSVFFSCEPNGDMLLFAIEQFEKRTIKTMPKSTEEINFEKPEPDFEPCLIL